MFGFSSIDSFLDAVPTAELEPSTDGYVQNDEDDIGLTYSELNDIGKLRKVSFGLFVSLTVSLTVSLMFFDISLTLSKERRMYTCLCLFIYISCCQLFYTVSTTSGGAMWAVLHVQTSLLHVGDEPQGAWGEGQYCGKAHLKSTNLVNSSNFLLRNVPFLT